MAADGSDRRSIVLAGVGVFGAILVLVVVAMVADGGAGDPVATTSTVACEPDDAACLAAQQSSDRPGIIPQPGAGSAPAEPGERGGWEQLALLGVILAAVAIIATVVVRSARRSGRGGPSDAADDDGTALRASS